MVTQRLIEADAKRCHSCSSGLQTSDSFCRSCGISQTTGAVTPDSNENWRHCETTVLNNDNEIDTDESLSSSLDDTLTQTETYESLSSPLVKTLTQNIATRTSSLRSNRFSMSIVAVLIAIPIWLLIILLSPIDAYTAIRAIASQMNCK
ncbi:MAG TPA: hypothetical protein VJX74_12250 [Blastocatellia bacterium]|nr:hypothetical protein [Blastocatellia bacterium]